MASSKLRYNEFADQIDIDALEAAIGFDIIDQQGANDVGHCPLPHGLHKHGDTTGKFAIHREKMVYHCWVCGGGNLLSLAMEVNDMDVDTATKWLYQFAHGDTRTDQEFAEFFESLIAPEEKPTLSMPYFNPRVLDKFDDDTYWFNTRGISNEVIERHNLRYSNVTMKPAPVRQRNGVREKIDDDYYGPAAIFPHYWKSQLVGWQNRWMNWDAKHIKTPKWLAKYTNTTEFPKKDTLFNFDCAIVADEPVIVCESCPTVLFLESNDIPAVSYFGGSINETQLKLLRRFQKGVILAPDNDEVGNTFVKDATEYLERFIEVKVLPPVPGKAGSDLGDFADKPFCELREFLALAKDPDPLNI